MKHKNAIIPLLVLLGYRESNHNLPKKNEVVLLKILLMVYILYYFFTVLSIYYEPKIKIVPILAWVASLIITAIDNVRRLVTGFNRFDEYKNNDSNKKVIFHNGFYYSILFVEIISLAYTLLKYCHSCFFEMNEYSNNTLIIVCNLIFMFQSLIHTSVDVYGMEDIE